MAPRVNLGAFSPPLFPILSLRSPPLFDVDVFQFYIECYVNTASRPHFQHIAPHQAPLHSHCLWKWLEGEAINGPYADIGLLLSALLDGAHLPLALRDGQVTQPKAVWIYVSYHLQLEKSQLIHPALAQGLGRDCQVSQVSLIRLGILWIC